MQTVDSFLMVNVSSSPIIVSESLSLKFRNEDLHSWKCQLIQSSIEYQTPYFGGLKWKYILACECSFVKAISCSFVVNFEYCDDFPGGRKLFQATMDLGLSSQV